MSSPWLLRAGSVVWTAIALSLLLTGAAQAATATYFITVNTASVAGTSGYLDFQFNPANIASPTATATVSRFSGGTLGTSLNTGNVSGNLSSALVLVNSTPLNESVQAFTFGSSFTFVLTLSGPALTPAGLVSAGTTFGVGLYDSSLHAILTNQGLLTGFATQIDINPSGAVTDTAFPATTNGPSAVAVQASPTGIPTLSEWGVLACALLLGGFGVLSLRRLIPVGRA